MGKKPNGSASKNLILCGAQIQTTGNFPNAFETKKNTIKKPDRFLSENLIDHGAIFKMCFSFEFGAMVYKVF